MIKQVAKALWKANTFTLQFGATSTTSTQVVVALGDESRDIVVVVGEACKLLFEKWLQVTLMY